MTFHQKNNFLEKIILWIGTPMSLIIHTVFFISMLSLIFFGVSSDRILLILTTLVSLEAIYLSIFIQMGVNIGRIEQKESHNESKIFLSNIKETVDDVQETIEEE